MRIVVIGAEPLFRYQILDGIEWTVWIRAYGAVGQHPNIPLIRPKTENIPQETRIELDRHRVPILPSSRTYVLF